MRLVGRGEDKDFRVKKMKRKLVFYPVLVAPLKDKITLHLPKVAEHILIQTPHSYVLTHVPFIRCC